MARLGAAALLALGLAHCSQVANKYGVTASQRVVTPGEPVPKGGGVYRVGKPYVIAGQTYTPEENPNYSSEGLASWYGDDFHGRQTANGEVFDVSAISAAHPTLPMPSYVRVTNLNNRRSLIVRVNDRGPYHPGRVIDVSARAAKLLGFYDEGTTRVRVDYVGRASLDGSDDAKLAATLQHGSPLTAPTVVAARAQATSPNDLGRYFDPKPLTRQPAAIRAPQPEPQVRPVRTANQFPRAPVRPQPIVAPVQPVYGIASSRPVPGAAYPATGSQTTFATRFGPAAPRNPVNAEPLSAYAPTPMIPAGVLTGRGLY